MLAQPTYPLLTLVLTSLISCASVKKVAIDSVIDMLVAPGGTNVFTSDDDPELIAESLPLALKIYETLMVQAPDNIELTEATGRNFVMYSGAFVHMPADMLESELWEEAEEARLRAKKLYYRGRKYLLESLEMSHEGFIKTLNSGDYDDAMAMLESADISKTYWTALAWLGMASTDPFEMELLTSLDKAILLLFRAMQLDDTKAEIHDIMIQVYTSLPNSTIPLMRERSPRIAMFMDNYYEAAGVLESPTNRALYHYERAIALSGNTNPSPHITMATTVCIKKQDAEAYTNYLNKALEIDPNKSLETRLMTILYQKKARWLLDNIENFFLMDVNHE